MTPHDIKLGTRFELDIIDEKTREKVSGTYVSQLLEHQDDGLLVISAPIHETRLIYIPNNSLIRLTFVRAPYGVFGMPALVKSKESRGNIAVLIVEPVGEIENVYRRSNYRLSYNTDVLIWLETSDENEPIKAHTKDISGSGLRVVCDTYIPKKTKVKIELSLPSDLKIRCESIILRSVPIKLSNGNGYEYGLHFTDISKRDQDALIKFIFYWQRKLLKKMKK